MITNIDYINFILFYQPNKHLEVGTLVNRDSSITNRIHWDSSNIHLKEIQAKGIDLLKVSGTHLPLYGPYAKYTSEFGLSHEYYQGILLNNTLTIPHQYKPINYNAVIQQLHDKQISSVYKLIYNQIQDFIARKNVGY